VSMSAAARTFSTAANDLRQSSISVRDFAVYRGFPLWDARRLEDS
jgi:hypothetical protein